MRTLARSLFTFFAVIAVGIAGLLCYRVIQTRGSLFDVPGGLVLWMALLASLALVAVLAFALDPSPRTSVYPKPRRDDWPYYVAAGVGIAFGWGLMFVPLMLPPAAGPHWIPTTGQVIATLAINIAFIPGYRRRKRKRAGCWAECGYDLRATSTRCPECGTPAT